MQRTLRQVLNKTARTHRFEAYRNDKGKGRKAVVVEEDIETTIESAEECPGECIYIEAQ
ncbi:MAG: hypothetical protein VX983_06225 [Actinomycetota bacterium]|nr:hypothetical protein [Actinomycetota bacterium]